MMVYGCICAHMDVYESICWYMYVDGSKGMYIESVWNIMTVNECI